MPHDGRLLQISQTAAMARTSFIESSRRVESEFSSTPVQGFSDLVMLPAESNCPKQYHQPGESESPGP
jgi:hypothetical protein